MPETEHGIYYPESKQTPNVPADMEKAAKSIDVVLGASNHQPLSWLKSSEKAGQIIVTNKSGVPQYVTGGGDLTVDSSGSFQLGAGVVGMNELAVALAAELGVDGSKGDASIVATEETRTGTSFASLTTEDKAVVTLAQPGLLRIAVLAEINSSKAGAGRIAVFINGTQVKHTVSEIGIEGSRIGETLWTLISTGPNELRGAEAAKNYGTELMLLGEDGTSAGSPWLFRAPAGTYTITLRYAATSGSVSARNRCLYAEAKEFH